MKKTRCLFAMYALVGLASLHVTRGESPPDGPPLLELTLGGTPGSAAFAIVLGADRMLSVERRVASPRTGTAASDRFSQHLTEGEVDALLGSAGPGVLEIAACPSAVADGTNIRIRFLIGDGVRTEECRGLRRAGDAGPNMKQLLVLINSHLGGKFEVY